MIRLRRIAFSLLFLAFCSIAARCEENLPPAPHDYFNDYAHLVPAATGKILNQLLTDFDRETSNQMVVAIFPRMESATSIEDYTVRVAQSWRAGSRQHDNGAVLFIFVQERKIYIQVGYGLEGRLTDARCRQIIANEISPRFAAGRYDEGVQYGIYAMLDAVRGEYQGNGKTAAGGSTAADDAKADKLWIAFGVLGVLAVIVAGCVYLGLHPAMLEEFTSTGRQSNRDPSGTLKGLRTALFVASLLSRTGGRSGGQGGQGSSGGGFSGGGGRFGGGGAGGSW